MLDSFRVSSPLEGDAGIAEGCPTPNLSLAVLLKPVVRAFDGPERNWLELGTMRFCLSISPGLEASRGLIENSVSLAGWRNSSLFSKLNRSGSDGVSG